MARSPTRIVPTPEDGSSMYTTNAGPPELGRALPMGDSPSAAARLGATLSAPIVARPAELVLRKPRRVTAAISTHLVHRVSRVVRRGVLGGSIAGLGQHQSVTS